MAEKKTKQSYENRPIWLDSDNGINDLLFCSEYLAQYPMVCINNALFSVDGIIHEDAVKNRVHLMTKDYFPSNHAKRAEYLLSELKMECYAEPLSLQTDRIHIANGTLFLDGTFTEKKEFCLNRLPIEYRPDAPHPEKWLAFLDELFYPEDIPTLQEYMGYCLIPTTKAQQMLFVIGKGGEGKSRIGVVMESLLGKNMKTGSIDKLQKNKFALADLEYELLMVDDDLNLGSLPETGKIKSVVTAELPMDLEKKSIQSYQGLIYSRLLCFGNGIMHANNDKSAGFYRRQIIVTVRDKSENRVDDPYIAEKMCAEKEGIFLWCLEGLQRLIGNNYEFTISERTRENLAEAVKQGNNIIPFLQSTGYIQLGGEGQASSRDLYDAYRLWCEDNVEDAQSKKTFCNHLGQYYREYGLGYTDKIKGGNGKFCRGYLGVTVLNKKQ